MCRDWAGNAALSAATVARQRREVACVVAESGRSALEILGLPAVSAQVGAEAERYLEEKGGRLAGGWAIPDPGRCLLIAALQTGLVGAVFAWPLNLS